MDDGRTGVGLGLDATGFVPYGDFTGVPLYRADGTSVDAPPEAEAGDQPSLLSALPTSTATPTPLVTPVLRLPEVESRPAASVPAPEAGEQVVTIGASIPPDPLAPVAAVAADGRPRGAGRGRCRHRGMERHLWRRGRHLGRVVGAVLARRHRLCHRRYPRRCAGRGQLPACVSSPRRRRRRVKELIARDCRAVEADEAIALL